MHEGAWQESKCSYRVVARLSGSTRLCCTVTCLLTDCFYHWSRWTSSQSLPKLILCLELSSLSSKPEWVYHVHTLSVPTGDFSVFCITGPRESQSQCMCVYIFVCAKVYTVVIPTNGHCWEWLLTCWVSVCVGVPGMQCVYVLQSVCGILWLLSVYIAQLISLSQYNSD